MFANIINGIKGAVFEGEETPASAPVAQPAHASKAGPANPGTTYVPTHGINQTMVDLIRKQTFSRSTALTTLISQADALVDIVPDPVQRLKVAQKTAGQGRASKDFIDAVQIHLNDVDAELRKFDQMIETKVSTEVGGLKAQVATTESQINSSQQEIQQLTARIQTLHEQAAAATTKRAELMAEVSSKEHELRQTAAEFKAAAEVVRAELNAHKQTILSTLG